MADNYNRRFIAIDYGTRRIGLARSDPTGTIASALTTIEVKSFADAVKKVADIIENETPDGLVIGYPLLPSGDKGNKCGEIDRFVEKLRGLYNGPIEMVNEQYSSQEAAKVIHAHGQKVGKDKKRLDRIAAVIILQRYLDDHPT